MTADTRVFLFRAFWAEEGEKKSTVAFLEDQGFFDVRFEHYMIAFSTNDQDVRDVDVEDMLIDEFALEDVDLHEYRMPPASGRNLIVNLMYKETGQVVSAVVDEVQWAAIVSQTRFRRTAADTQSHAAFLLYSDIDIPSEYAFDDDIEVQDVMRSVEFWDEAAALTWMPEFWDENDAMAVITVRPFITMKNPISRGDGLGGDSGQVEMFVNFPRTRLSHVRFNVPVRLAEKFSANHIVNTPAAPEIVRTWLAVGDAKVTIEMPEPEAEIGCVP